MTLGTSVNLEWLQHTNETQAQSRNTHNPFPNTRQAACAGDLNTHGATQTHSHPTAFNTHMNQQTEIQQFTS